MKQNTSFFKSMRLLLLGVFMLPLLYSQSNAQYCDASTDVTSGSEYINGVKFNTIDNQNNGASLKVQDWTNLSTNVYAGSTYDIKLSLGNSYNGDMAYLWIDFNNDYTYSTTSEEYHLDPYNNSSISGKILIPSNTIPGTYRMRIRLIDFLNDNYGYTYPNPCGAMTWGETEEYTLKVTSGYDAGIVDITNPISPFIVGNYNVQMKIKNSGTNTITSAKINWSVDNVAQTPVNWTGSLSTNQTATISVGLYNFNYPPTGPFNPFSVSASISNLNNQPYDDDPSNNQLDKTLSPILNDCGVIGFFGPPEGFGAGVTAVKARVKNYAPKPLTSVTVNWKIDGTTQTPATFSGLNLKNGETIDLDVGTFTFYNKTPLGPFSVEVVTSNPNGVPDENTSNDKYVGGIGPSLTAGTYFAGGSNAHFSSPSEAASYLNSSGVFGGGDVIVEIRPGTYNGQVILNNKLPNDNPVTFRSSTGSAYDVVLSNSPSTANNFVLQLASINNVTFKSITVQNNNSNFSNAGRLVEATNMNGLKFESMVFNGIATTNGTNNVAYNLVTLMDVNNVVFTANDFNNGSYSVWNSSSFSPTININKCNFLNYSAYGIYNAIANGFNGNNVSFSQNTFKKSNSNYPNGAIYSMNGTYINGNTISDIIGTGNANDALIKIVHSSPNSNNVAWVENNIISNCSNIDGIQLTNAYAMVNKNHIEMSQNPYLACAMIDISGSVGAVGNNMLMGSNIMALDIDNSPMLDVIYNTASVEFNLNPVVRVTGISPNIMRNIFINKGTGTAIQVASALNIDQNVLYTNGVNIVNINGVNYADMNAVHNAGFMPASSAVNVEFFSPSDPHLKIYNAALLNNTPLFNIGTNWNGWYIESSDFDGENRISYFSGSDEIFLIITIERQTDGFVDCVGTTYNILTVSSAIGYNAPMTYQWELDGVPVAGANQPILYFPKLRHNQAGIYKCLVKGPGATVPVYSTEVAVYVTRPTDITREPESQSLVLGDLATLKVEAHVNGVDLETALANQTVKVQWYKYVDGANDIPLVDNKWISGSKSNYLTINKFRSSDVGTYYAVIIGLCGTVKTAKADLTEESNEIIIVQQPIDLSDCGGKDVIFNVNASTPGTKLINYQWYKDGSAIIDNLPDIEGSQSKHLIIYGIDAADAGQYYVIATLEGTQMTKQSDVVTLTVGVKPVITEQPLDATVESGRQLFLSVTAQGNDVSEVLTYKWYKDGALVSTLTIPDYIVNVTTPDDAGDYYVVVSNDCGAVTSLMAVVVITTGTTDVVEVSKNGYSLSTAMPNPVQGNSVISFNVPLESYVKITLSDVSGAANAVLTEGNFAIGTHHINLDAHAKNLVSGTYFYILESNGVRIAQKLVVIR